MSQYKTIETQFKTLPSLIQALADVGITAEHITLAADPKRPDLKMRQWGGGVHPQLASLRLNKDTLGGYEDTGFYWNGSAYQAIVSTHDTNRPGHRDFGESTFKQVTQRYAVAEARRLAKIKGYTVQEIKNPDGTVRLTCTKR